MGHVASGVYNAMMDSSWSTMQRELLDRQRWAKRTELASAMSEWNEEFYNRSDATPVSTRTVGLRVLA